MSRSLARAALAQHMVDLMRAFGSVQARAMFGGHGLYRDGLMFALLLDERLYLKVDDDNQAAFDAHGLRPFTYVTKDGKTGRLRYHEAPPEVFEDPQVMAHWARVAYEAAVRAGAKAAKKSARAAAIGRAPAATQDSAKKDAAPPPTATKAVKGATLAQLRNLGPASAAMLWEAGIRTPSQLRQLGAVRAFDRVRQRDPKASLNLLWAIEGALSDRPWQQVADEDRASLLMALEDLRLLRG
ncbi:MAG: TfoX/Sxy family DNA transformation protein [Aquabacterium sp.]